MSKKNDLLMMSGYLNTAYNGYQVSYDRIPEKGTSFDQ